MTEMPCAVIWMNGKGERRKGDRQEVGCGGYGIGVSGMGRRGGGDGKGIGLWVGGSSACVYAM